MLLAFSYRPSTAFFLFGHIARMPDKTDEKKILTASPWRTGPVHQDVLVLQQPASSGMAVWETHLICCTLEEETLS